MNHTEPKYEAFALRYASRPGMKSEHFFHYALYQEPDTELGLDYYFWVLRNQNRTVLVDCGYNRDRALERKNRRQDVEPVELLKMIDVRPQDVDHLVISHMHHDHAGNINLFPNATVSIAKEELAFWTGEFAGRDIMAWTVDSEDVKTVQRLAKEERLVVVDGESDVAPGISVTRLPGHTPGQLITHVDGLSGRLVLASDALHYYEEMDRDRPFSFFHDLEQTYRSYGELRALRDQGSTIIAGHDPAVMTRFQRVNDHCVDLTTQWSI
ncbi:N-acyl homoserine lactonase family protein [Arthrobacter methylotrophus]